MELNELYKEVILDHYRKPRNAGKLESPTISHKGHNPLCGDEVILHIKIEDDRVTDISFEGEGCSISQSSISMMTEKIKGLTLEDVRSLVEHFHKMMRDEDDSGVDMGELEALRGVRQFPARIKCALLGWDSLIEALDVTK